MSIQALRISKTSVSPWTLHGPVDQALKTTIQAEGVRCHDIGIDLHGVPVWLELWTNAADPEQIHEAPNPYAMVMLQVQRCRETGDLAPKSVTIEMEDETIGMTSFSMSDLQTLVRGPAILTGAGVADIPDHNIACIFAAAMGQVLPSGADDDTDQY